MTYNIDWRTLPDVVILRAVSGAGKSTLAQRIFRLAPSIIVSADAFFGDVYAFDPAKLPAAHADCLNRYLVALRTNRRIIVDNTNTTAVEIAPYYALAEAYMRSVEVFTLDVPPDIAHARNVHSVPIESVRRQHERLVTEQLPSRWKHRVLVGEEENAAP